MKLTDEWQRRCVAFHEASHAVVAYCFGWWVNHEGVEIDERWYCGLRRTIDANTVEAEICVHLAGFMAERLLNSHLPLSSNIHDLEIALDDAQGDWGTADSDDEAAFARLLSEHPDLEDDALIALYRKYEARTLSLLREPAVWKAVEDVAGALVKNGFLAASEVEKLIPEEVRDSCACPERELAVTGAQI